LGDQNFKKKAGGACSTHMRKENCMYDFGGKPEGGKPLENSCVIGRTIIQ